MPIPFHKMHGAGNDFVLIDARESGLEITPELAAMLSDRRLGIGCDQVLVLREAHDSWIRARYEIWNADGSPAAQCGNGARCIALYLEISEGVPEEAFSVESPAGVVTMRRCADGEYEIEMGVPGFEPGEVPTRLQHRDGIYRLQTPWNEVEFGAVSMGNPHVLLTGVDIDGSEVPALGEFISRHEAFPEGCNVGFARVEGRQKIRLRVVERGAGETLACGSGACAAVAILRRRGEVDDTVEVFLPGGRLVIKWRGNQEPMSMKGPAAHVFRGTLNE